VALSELAAHRWEELQGRPWEVVVLCLSECPCSSCDEVIDYIRDNLPVYFHDIHTLSLVVLDIIKLLDDDFRSKAGRAMGAGAIENHWDRYDRQVKIWATFLFHWATLYLEPEEKSPTKIKIIRHHHE